MKYRIHFEGYAEIEADDLNEAEDLFWCEDYEYRSYDVVDIEEIDELDYLI